MNDFHQKLTAFRRDLHRHPELGFEETRTKAKIATALRALGLSVSEGVGVVGVLKCGNGTRAIALRADMDALPISETSAHDYSSLTPGVMHACGHDGHTTMLLGAAELLSQSQDFDGTVIFIFQPNEEHGLGARAMLDDGFNERFAPDEIYAIHNLPGAPLAEISTRIGQICASESLFEIHITGQGGHASMPHLGVDAITVAAELVMALQTIVARKLPPGAGAVVSVTEISSDGQRNVLPGTALLKGDVRARLPQDRDAIRKFMKQITSGLAATHNVQIDMEFNTEFIETINAKEPTDSVIRVANAQGLTNIGNRPAMSFSEDFAQFSAVIPGCFFLLGNGTDGPHGQALHRSNYDFNDALLPVGANLWAALVRDRLPKR